MFQIVQVVSILAVPTMEGSTEFQSKEVNGAQFPVDGSCNNKRFVKL